MLNANNITDEQIYELRDSLPRGHYMISVCADALGSSNHPQRKRNTRSMCAEYIKAWPATAKQLEAVKHV